MPRAHAPAAGRAEVGDWPVPVSQVAMLASLPGEPSPDEAIAARSDGSWVFEPKWDGVRCLAFVRAGTVTLMSRRQLPITHRYPEVVAALRAGFPRREVVLDGELVCLDAAGLPSFSRIHRRDSQQAEASIRQLARDSPAIYLVFDLLALGGEDLRALTYDERVTRLDRLAPGFTRAGPTVQPTQRNADAQRLWPLVIEHRMEGMVAKRRSSRYEPRRSPSWVKIKANRSLAALVTGIDPGNGARALSFGALRVSLWDSDRLREVGAVGSGFSAADLAEVVEHIRSGSPLVIEVEYLEVTPTGQLRFPVFKGIRDDVDPSDCTAEQFGAARR